MNIFDVDPRHEIIGFADIATTTITLRKDRYGLNINNTSNAYVQVFIESPDKKRKFMLTELPPGYIFQIHKSFAMRYKIPRWTEITFVFNGAVATTGKLYVSLDQ